MSSSGAVGTTWNVVVTLPEATFVDACRLLGRWGKVKRTHFYNVLAMRVADPRAFLHDFAQAVAEAPGLRNIVSHVVPAQRTFDFQTHEDFAQRARDILHAWLPQLAGASFYVRLHRRGGKEVLASQPEERSLDAVLLSPPLGAIADAAGRRKPWLLVFTLLCMLGSALLWFARPTPGSALPAIACIVIANLGFEFGVVFNNAMLPDIVAEPELGRLSGWAWGLGYCGGLAALVITLLLFIAPGQLPFGLDPSQAEQVRVLGPLAAIWFAVFAWPLFAFTPDRPPRAAGVRRALVLGMRQMRALLPELRRRPDLLRFLLAHMLYADGLATLFAFGGVYAAGTFGTTLPQVVAFGVLLNVAAGMGAFGFGWMDDWIGSRRTVLLTLAGLIAAGLVAVLAQSRGVLWVSGAIIGLFVGPVQAASRSFMARLSPPDRQAEFFGLFALSGRATTFAGPALVALLTEVSGSQRLGMGVIIVLCLAGLSLLAGVREPARPPAGQEL